MRGIYKIRNALTGKEYIGSAIDINGRWNAHRSKLRRCVHHCRHLQNAWNKYGEHAFEFFVVESVERKESLTVIEQLYLDVGFANGSLYNANPRAASCLGTKRSEAFKKRLSESSSNRRPEVRAKMSAAQILRCKTPEGIAHIKRIAAASKEPVAKARQVASFHRYFKTNEGKQARARQIIAIRLHLETDEGKAHFKRMCDASNTDKAVAKQVASLLDFYRTEEGKSVIAKRRKLTPQKLEEIRHRAEHETQSTLAREYGISQATVSNIICRKYKLDLVDRDAVQGLHEKLDAIQRHIDEAAARGL